MLKYPLQVIEIIMAYVIKPKSVRMQNIRLTLNQTDLKNDEEKLNDFSKLLSLDTTKPDAVFIFW